MNTKRNIFFIAGLILAVFPGILFLAYNSIIDIQGINPFTSLGIIIFGVPSILLGIGIYLFIC